MLTYVTRRVLYSIPVLLVSSFLSFTFVSLAGDPLANLRQDPKVSQLTLHLLVHKYHLDASIPVRHWYWLQDVRT
jgi:peptide/nickel transport system permease protein